MNTRNLLAAIAMAALTIAGNTVFAHDVVYTATLTGATESPVNASPAVGNAIVTFNVDTFTMRVQATFSGLLGTTTASHIHCCTAVAGTGTAGVATVTPTFTGFPLGVTAGSYDATYNMSLASSWNSAFVTANSSVANAFTALSTALDSGTAYLNIHTSAFGGGEIRGFLTAAPVPEPETYGMLLAGLALVSAVARRRKVAA
jgi:hypothetical protein